MSLSSRFSARLPIPGSRLSARLLLLTLFFVMVAEVLIFAPSVGRYRMDYLEQRLGAAHLALLAVEATPDGMVDHALQRRLLDHAGTLRMTAWRPNRAKLMLGDDMEITLDAEYDVRERRFFPLIGQALAALVRTEARTIGVMGFSPKDPQVVVDAVISEQPMIHQMREYAGRIFLLSLAISGFTAGLVYLSLHLLLVRPLRRMAANMQSFQDAPEDDSRILRPSSRTDEVGEAERALAGMEGRLREALYKKDRLAAVGTAVSKISHDLKGVLTTALLESDRLETSAADPDVKAVTQGIARALERAVTLCTTTLRFAQDGPPTVRIQSLAVVDLLAEVADLQQSDDFTWAVTVDAALRVAADSDLTLRVLENLGRNAMQAGASRLEVTARVCPGDGAGRGESVFLRLADNGRGMPQRALDNLFRPFSGSARAGGTGLGLPIARELLAAQGGRLDLEDTAGTGTAFLIRLPLSRDAAPPVLARPAAGI